VARRRYDRSRPSIEGAVSLRRGGTPVTADRAEQLHSELTALLARHEPTLTDGDRADLVRLEEGYGWRPGRRPARPEPQIAAFLDLFDRAEQEELTYRTLAAGTVDELRDAFRRALSEAR
jgi:hypothetical protein